MNRPKGCISLHPHTQVLTKVPVFPMEKQLLCLPRPTICAKYSSQGIYKANKTHSSLLAEKRYSNNRLPIQHPNPGLLHRRVRSKHLTNTRPSAVARFHHKLAEVRLTPHSVPTQSLTFLVLSIDSQTMSLSLPEKKVLNIQNKCQSHSQSHSISLRSGKPHKDIGSSPPCHLAGPPTLQTNTNTAQKIPTGFSRQSQDTYVLKQECSHRTSAVAPEHSNRKRQYHQSSCPQAVHNLRRLQSGLKWEIHESNSSNLVSALLTQCQKDAENHGTMCFYRSTMGLRHSFTCPYQGQAFFYVLKSGSKH